MSTDSNVIRFDGSSLLTAQVRDSLRAGGCCRASDLSACLGAPVEAVGVALGRLHALGVAMPTYTFDDGACWSLVAPADPSDAA